MAPLALLLVTGLDGRWHPGIGDPTLVGWTTVVAYGVAAYLAWTAVVAARGRLDFDVSDESARRRLVVRFWSFACVLMVALGLNKQLDLQSWLTEIGRDLALSQGWYEERRRYQAMFVLAVLVAGAIGGLALAYALRSVLRRLAAGLVGLVVIAAFVVIRAASFHHVDALLPGVLGLNATIELPGIALVGLGAWRSARWCGSC